MFINGRTCTSAQNTKARKRFSSKARARRVSRIPYFHGKCTYNTVSVLWSASAHRADKSKCEVSPQEMVRGVCVYVCVCYHPACWSQCRQWNRGRTVRCRTGKLPLCTDREDRNTEWEAGRLEDMFSLYVNLSWWTTRFKVPETICVVTGS